MTTLPTREFIRTASTHYSSDMSQLETYIKSREPNIIKYIILENRHDTTLFHTAISMGADINELDETDKSPLYIAIEECNLLFFSQLLFNNASLSATGPKNHMNTPLHLAIIKNLIFYTYYLCWAAQKTVSLPLLKTILDAERSTMLNKTPLQIAVSSGFLQCAKILCAAGADVNKVGDITLKTPLHIAVKRNNPEMVKLLIEMNAVTSLFDKDGKTPIDYATPKMAEIIQRKTEDIPAPAISSDNAENYIFSQRGATCGTDSLFNVLFFTPPFGTDFQAAAHMNAISTKDPLERRKEEEEKVNHETEGMPLIDKMIAKSTRMLNFNRTVDPIQTSLYFAFKRFRNMIGLQTASRAAGILKREKSLNTGEGATVLKCISSESFGSNMYDIEKAIQKILIENKYGILKSDYNLRMTKIDSLKREAYSIPEFGKVCAFFASFTIKGRGHFVAFIKREDGWYFVDNEVGLLKRIKDESFMGEFYENMKTHCEIQKCLFLGRQGQIPVLFTGKKQYPNTESVLNSETLFSENIAFIRPLESAIILYQETIATVGGTERRQTRRRQTRDRATRRRRQRRA